MLFVHSPCAITVYCNCHLHQHFRSSSNSVDMLNMFSAQDFLWKVAFLIRVGADASSLTPFHFLNSPHDTRARLARQFCIYPVGLDGCQFIPWLLIILDFYTFTCFKCWVCRQHLGNFIPFTGWLLLWLFKTWN